MYTCEICDQEKPTLKERCNYCGQTPPSQPSQYNTAVDTTDFLFIYFVVHVCRTDFRVAVSLFRSSLRPLLGIISNCGSVRKGCSKKVTSCRDSNAVVFSMLICKCSGGDTSLPFLHPDIRQSYILAPLALVGRRSSVVCPRSVIFFFYVFCSILR